MTATQALEHAFATVRTAAEFNAMLDAAGPLAEAAAKRLGLVSRGGVYVPAEQPKPAPTAKAKPKAKTPAPVKSKANANRPKVAAQQAKAEAPKVSPLPDEKAQLVVAYKAAKLPGYALCSRWGTETLRRKLAEAKGTKQAAKKPAPKATKTPKAAQATPPGEAIDLANATVAQLKGELAQRLGLTLADLDAALALAGK
jgi:outer membrane biosynthesis protein TonB